MIKLKQTLTIHPPFVKDYDNEIRAVRVILFHLQQGYQHVGRINCWTFEKRNTKNATFDGFEKPAEAENRKGQVKTCPFLK